MSKLQPIAIRLSAFAFVTGKPCNPSRHHPFCLECTIQLAIPVELTGFYDVGADGRIDRVEIYIPGSSCIWVAPLALCDEYTPMPIDYRTLRRALLILYFSGANRFRDYRGARQLSAYERVSSSKDSY